MLFANLEAFFLKLLTPKRVKQRSASPGAATAPVQSPAPSRDWQRAPGAALPAELPTLTDVDVSHDAPPSAVQLKVVLAPVAAVPVAGPIIAGVIGGLATLTDALGLQGGRDETPWGNPPWAGYDGLNDFTWQQQNAYNPLTGRFENPDGSWPFIFPSGSHIGGISFAGRPFHPEQGGPLAPYMNAQGVIVDAAMRQHWTYMHACALAAKAVNWDRSKVGADGYTLLGFTPPPLPDPQPVEIESAAPAPVVIDAEVATPTQTTLVSRYSGGLIKLV
jgi:hypothetical protein